MSNPAALVADALNQLRNVQKTLETLKELLNTPPPVHRGNTVKEADGRLTDVGIHSLYKEFADGHLTNGQVATKHEISLSAVLKRKAMWRKCRS